MQGRSFKLEMNFREVPDGSAFAGRRDGIR